MYANARSIVKPGKFDELCCTMKSLKSIIHILILTETWIKSADEAHRLQIPGYTHYYHLRQNTIGGGVSIFAINSLKHHQIEELSQDDNHFLWIHLNKFCIDIGAVYKPGRTNVKKFLDNFSLQLNRRNRAIVFGDFNLDLLHSNNDVKEYKETLQENGYRIVNKISTKYCTRETSQKQTLLDHVLTNLKENQFHLVIIESTISDHKQIFFEINKYQPPKKININYEAVDYRKLLIHVQEIMKDRENCIFSKFEQTIINTIQKCKVKKIKVINPPRQDWVDTKICNKIKRKNHLYQLSKRCPQDENIKNMLTTEKKIVSEEIQRVKSEYYKKKFSACKNKPKKMWSLIDSLTHNRIKDVSIPSKLEREGLTVTKGIEICEYFNEYFSTVGSSLAQAIPVKYHNNKIYTSALIKNQQNNFGLAVLKPATKKEVLKIINNLDINSSSGIDNVNTKTIKCVKHHIVDELTNCINYCLEQGTFPNNLKIAKVTPIFKSGKRSDPNNYRPISVLPVMSKIFEKILYNRLETYLNSINFLYNKQYGFRPKSNTLSATVDIITKIKTNIDEKKICLGIFIDLKKAFDTVSHKILLQKLTDIGITDKAHKILESYLMDRSQVVKIAEFQSSTKPITYGIPQGSLLGPLLFLIYMNNISKLDLNGELSLYADDTSLFYFGHNIDSIIQHAQNDLNLLNIWFHCNLLTINTDKTHYVIFAAKNKKIMTLNHFKSTIKQYIGRVVKSI